MSIDLRSRRSRFDSRPESSSPDGPGLTAHSDSPHSQSLPGGAHSTALSSGRGLRLRTAGLAAAEDVVLGPEARHRARRRRPHERAAAVHSRVASQRILTPFRRSNPRGEGACSQLVKSDIPEPLIGIPLDEATAPLVLAQSRAHPSPPAPASSVHTSPPVPPAQPAPATPWRGKVASHRPRRAPRVPPPPPLASLPSPPPSSSSLHLSSALPLPGAWSQGHPTGREEQEENKPA